MFSISQHKGSSHCDADGDSLTYTYSVDDEYDIYDTVNAPLPTNGVISLVAKRDGNDIDGRGYTIIVTVSDGVSATTASVNVLVPHDMRGKKN